MIKITKIKQNYCPFVEIRVGDFFNDGGALMLKTDYASKDSNVFSLADCVFITFAGTSDVLPVDVEIIEYPQGALK